MSRKPDLYPLSAWLFWVVALPGTIALALLTVFATTDAGDLPLDNPDLWWVVCAIPFAMLLAMFSRARCRRAVLLFGGETLSTLLAQRVSRIRPAARTSLFVLAIGFLSMAIMGPRWGLFLDKQEVRGVDIMVAVDVSRSMLARDVEPNRLERAKKEIRQQLIERNVFQQAHRLGLIAFAGSTSLKVPLTTDHLAFRSQLERLSLNSAPKGGTAIAEAIRASADLFRASPENATKIILILTDGEDHVGGPVEAAREVAELGIKVYTIGVGDPELIAGAEVPATESRNEGPLLHDGQIVFSKIDTAGLSKIAEAGQGQFCGVRDFHRIVNAITKFKKAKLSTEERIRHKPRYQWFLAASLVCLFLETLIRPGKKKVDHVVRRLWQQEVQS